MTYRSRDPEELSRKDETGIQISFKLGSRRERLVYCGAAFQFCRNYIFYLIRPLVRERPDKGEESGAGTKLPHWPKRKGLGTTSPSEAFSFAHVKALESWQTRTFWIMKQLGRNRKASEWRVTPCIFWNESERPMYGRLSLCLENYHLATLQPDSKPSSCHC